MWWPRYRALIRRLLHPRAADQALDAEVQTYLEQDIEARRRAGMSAEDARRTALADLGGIDQLKAYVKDSQAGARLRALPNLGHDVRWATRGIRARGWSGVLSVTLMAIAIAASTLAFSATDALLLSRVPYPEPDRLVTVRSMVQRPKFESLRLQTDVFSGVSAHQPALTFLTTAAEPEPVNTAYVTPGLFETLGILPRWGRPFWDDDRRSVSPTVAIIDAALARERFGSPANAIGKVLTTSDRPLTIVGVMPPGFRYPDGEVRIWRALDFERLHETFPNMTMVGRLAPSMSMDEASARLTARFPEFVGKDSGKVDIVPRTFGQSSEERATMLRVLLAAALCLVLAACANVASLELADGIRRAGVLSIRMALGASRGSLIRVAMIEGACLAALAMALAAGLASAGASMLTSLLPDTIVFGGVNPIDIDWRALTFLVAIGAGVWLCASLPAVVYASRSNVLGVLKSQGSRASVSPAGAWVRRVVTLTEVALAVMLLVGGLLYLRTYSALLNVDTGMDTKNVVALRMTMPLESFSDSERTALVNRMEARLTAFPAVVSASRVLGAAPPGNAYTMRPVVELEDGRKAREQASITVYTVTPTFFRTMGLQPIRGRVFAGADPASLVVITDTLSRFLWADADPIGRSFRLDPAMPWTTVVGVVPHVRTNRDDRGGPSARAFSYFQTPRPAAGQPARPRDEADGATPLVNAPTGALSSSSTILLRLSDLSVVGELLGMARSVDPRARYTVEPLDATYAQRHAETRMAASIVTAFASVAFLIAIAGVFGVMTVVVNSRTREIGIRMALGAGAQEVRRMVFGSSLRLILAGVGMGLAAAVGASRYIESQLFGVTPTDPVTLGAVAATVTLAALLATAHPATRAARVDPAETLRAE